MFSDAVIPFVSDDMLLIVTRICICFSAFVLVYSYYCFDSVIELNDLKNNPDKSFYDSDLTAFIKSQKDHLSIRIKSEIFKGVTGCIISLLGIYLTIALNENVTITYSSYVFASYAVIALTIRAFFTSLSYIAMNRRFMKSELEMSKPGAAKRLIELNKKPLARSVSITLAGFLVSAYLLYHVTPSL